MKLSKNVVQLGLHYAWLAHCAPNQSIRNSYLAMVKSLSHTNGFYICPKGWKHSTWRNTKKWWYNTALYCGSCPALRPSYSYSGFNGYGHCMGNNYSGPYIQFTPLTKCGCAKRTRSVF